MFVENFNKLKTFNDSISHEFFPKFKITEIIFYKNFSLNFPPFFAESSSSADESEQKRQVSASDISDAELPGLFTFFEQLFVYKLNYKFVKKNCLHFSATASSGKESSDDLEELEKAKAALEAQLAAANISDEGMDTFFQLFDYQ